jgi:hypothetical protein
MKVPIDDYACIDLDAPVLPAYEAFVSGSVYWLDWCDNWIAGRPASRSTRLLWPEVLFLGRISLIQRRRVLR